MPVIESPKDLPKFKPGDHIRVTQRIVGRQLSWPITVEGTVLSFKPEATGSWFAHGKRDKLWLSRVRLKKADGEVTTLTLDGNSVVEILP